MKIRQLSIFEFDNFATNHPLGSYQQTSSYALFQSEQGKDYDLLGLINEKNEIIAASLIIIKKLNIFFSYCIFFMNKIFFLRNNTIIL